MKRLAVAIMLIASIVGCSKKESLKNVIITPQNIAGMQKSIQTAGDVSREEQQSFMLGQIQLGPKVMGKTVAEVITAGKESSTTSGAVTAPNNAAAPVVVVPVQNK